MTSTGRGQQLAGVWSPDVPPSVPSIDYWKRHQQQQQQQQQQEQHQQQQQKQENQQIAQKQEEEQEQQQPQPRRQPQPHVRLLQSPLPLPLPPPPVPPQQEQQHQHQLPQHYQHQLPQQDLHHVPDQCQHQQQPLLPPPPPPPPPTSTMSLQHQLQQSLRPPQQPAAWCADAAAVAECGNYVTTVTVAGWPVAVPPASSPRSESARSDAADSSCSSLSQESLSPPARPAAALSVTAPPRWNRVTSNGLVVYVSPSGVSLTSVEEAHQYLRTAGTCKCGLECPVLVQKSFNFDPKVTLRRKDVPPTFQEQRCNPHNNPFFREQMLQVMEQMGLQGRVPPLPQPGPMVAPPCWPADVSRRGGVPRLPRPHCEETGRRRAPARSRRRGGCSPAAASPAVDTSPPPQSDRPGPNFLDDPSGYLAQQTRMLNNSLPERLSPTSEVPLPASVGRQTPVQVASPRPSSCSAQPCDGSLPTPTSGLSFATTCAPSPTAATTVTSDLSSTSTTAVSSGLSPMVSSGLSPTLSSDLSPAMSSGLSPTVSSGLSPTVSSGFSPTLCSGLSPTVSSGLSPIVSAAVSGGRAAGVTCSRSGAAQYQLLGGPELPLMQSLPAGQIILPSGQVILTQPLQPMLQYVSALPVTGPQPVMLSGGLQLQLPEREPARATGRRRRRQPPSVTSLLQRSQPAAAAGVGPALLVGGKPTPVILNAAAQAGVNVLQPLLLPGAGGQQLFLQNVSGQLQLSAAPVASSSGAAPVVASAAPLLQLVSVVSQQQAAPTPLPAAPSHARMPADSSTGTPDGSEPVSSTGEPAESAEPPATKRHRAQDGEMTFCAGDLVWGSNGGLDSWPGQVMESCDGQTCDPAAVWVRWFGDHTISQEPTDKLRKLHDHSTGKHKKNPAENGSLGEAFQEALLAVERQRKQ